MSDIMTRNPAPGWTMYRLGQLFDERREKVSDKDFPPLSVTMNGIVPQLDSAAKTDDGDNRKLVRVGDYVINSRSDRKGSGGISNYDGSVSLISIVLEPKLIDPAFAHHLLRSTAFQEEFYRWGHGIVADLWTTRYSDMKNIRLFVPDLTTQRQIADFLDRETARIDLLIEKKQRMVELLFDRRRTLTGNYLSRGTRPGVELVKSGLDWLGYIPSHWKVFPLRELVWYQEGPGIMAEDFLDDGIPLLRIKGLSGPTATLTGCNYLDPGKVKKRWNHFRVEVGDLLISASATRGGIASEVTEETVGAIPYTGIIRIKPRKRGYTKALIPHFLLSSLFETQIDLLSAGSTIQHFGPSHLSRMKAPLPPEDEQLEIAQELTSLLCANQKLSDHTNASITRLREYRSSLITAAVTGQIEPATHARAGSTDRQLDAMEADSP
jgi:type I restriction enzyme S subunit